MDIGDPANVVVTGVRFPTADYDAVAIFMGVESSSSHINDAGSIAFAFDLGLPISSAAAPFQVRFDH